MTTYYTFEETRMSVTSDTTSGISIPGTSSHFLDPMRPSDRVGGAEGRPFHLPGTTRRASRPHAIGGVIDWPR